MNGNRIVLDTNIVLYLLAGDKTLADFLQNKKGYLSVITELELIGYQGITVKEHQRVKQFIESCTVTYINEDIKVIYAGLRKKYKMRLGDAIVAATAMHLDMPLITADRDFSRITELQLTQYQP